MNSLRTAVVLAIFGSLCSAPGAARADAAPPDVEACSRRREGRACILPDGTRGRCETVTRPVRHTGGSMGTYTGLACVPVPARTPPSPRH